MFVLTLFGVFATSCLLVVLTGASVYRSTVDRMDVHFEVNTSIAYVATKIRQGENVFIDTVNGKNALVFEQDFDGRIWQTWIYHYDGTLYEIFTSKEFASSLTAGTGQELMKVYDFSIEMAAENIISLSAKSRDGVSVRQLAGIRGL
jgi:hypothetical protein